MGRCSIRDNLVISPWRISPSFMCLVPYRQKALFSISWDRKISPFTSLIIMRTIPVHLCRAIVCCPEKCYWHRRRLIRIRKKE
jgi:hypothetical protein